MTQKIQTYVRLRRAPGVVITLKHTLALRSCFRLRLAPSSPGRLCMHACVRARMRMLSFSLKMSSVFLNLAYFMLLRYLIELKDKPGF